MLKKMYYNVVCKILAMRSAWKMTPFQRWGWIFREAEEVDQFLEELNKYLDRPDGKIPTELEEIVLTSRAIISFFERDGG